MAADAARVDASRDELAAYFTHATSMPAYISPPIERRPVCVTCQPLAGWYCRMLRQATRRAAGPHFHVIFRAVLMLDISYFHEL